MKQPYALCMALWCMAFVALRIVVNAECILYCEILLGHVYYNMAIVQPHHSTAYNVGTMRQLCDNLCCLSSL